MDELQLFIEQRYKLLEEIMFASHLSWVFLILVLYVLYKTKNNKNKAIASILLVGTLFFIYARYIERYWIQVNHIELERGWGSRVALIADQHLGVYKGGEYMTRVVEKINALDDIDFVVIAGDFTYWPVDLEREHNALKDLRVPVYAVLGNHDVQQSGHITYEKELQKLLASLNVQVLHNDIVVESGVSIYGLGNHWSHTDDVTLLERVTPDEKVLVLTHNPDTTDQEYPNVDLSNSVTMTGHTHCGQVRIPWLYKHAIPTDGDFPDRGPYDLGRKGTLLITCGLGEVGIPLRLFNRPEILVVDL